MIYAINRQTKEHRVVKSNGLICEKEWYAAHGWLLTHTDDDGWIPWEGGECPLPEGAQCEYKMRHAGVPRSQESASALRWSHIHYDADIIAYRPILDADTKPEAPEWDGEGLPPIGAWIEAKDDYSVWQRCRIAGREGAHLWLDYEEDGYTTGHMDDIDIRPIRSAEDKAVEEMLAIIENAESAADCCQALYRAGYRKEA